MDRPSRDRCALFARKFSRSVIGILKVGEVQRHAAAVQAGREFDCIWRDAASGEVLAVWISPGLVFPVPRRLVKVVTPSCRKAHRVTGSERARTLIAKQRVQKSRLKAGRIGKTNERRKVVPVVLVKTLARLAADEVQRATPAV